MSRPEDSAGGGDWVADATPTVPSEFARHLRVAGSGGGRPDGAVLAAAAWSELERTLAAGGDRDAAFHLLAADGLLTYACEDALTQEDPVAGLEELARGASGGRSPGEEDGADDTDRRSGA